jgi:hypothetical protein
MASSAFDFGTVFQLAWDFAEQMSQINRKRPDALCPEIRKPAQGNFKRKNVFAKADNLLPAAPYIVLTDLC